MVGRRRHLAFNQPSGRLFNIKTALSLGDPSAWFVLEAAIAKGLGSWRFMMRFGEFYHQDRAFGAMEDFFGDAAHQQP